LMQLKVALSTAATKLESALWGARKRVRAGETGMATLTANSTHDLCTIMFN
jgi:hypothetical protein